MSDLVLVSLIEICTVESLHADAFLLDDGASFVNDGHRNDGETAMAAASVTAVVVEDVDVIGRGLRVKYPKVVLGIRRGEFGSDELGIASEVLRQVVPEGAHVWPDLLRRIHSQRKSGIGSWGLNDSTTDITDQTTSESWSTWELGSSNLWSSK